MRRTLRDRVLLAWLPVAIVLATQPAFAQAPPYPPQPYPPQPYPPQPYPPQPVPPQPYPPQYPAQPYPGQPYPTHPGQPYPGQPYPPQPYPPQPYPQPLPPPAPKELVAEYEVNEPIYALVAVGAVTFSAAYLIPLIAAGASGFDNHSEWLGLPLLGPFITMGERSWNDDNGAPGVGLTLAGLFQLGGVAMFTVGLAVRRTYVEREYAVTPWVSPEGGGLGVVGRF